MQGEGGVAGEAAAHSQGAGKRGVVQNRAGQQQNATDYRRIVWLWQQQMNEIFNKLVSSGIWQNKAYLDGKSSFGLRFTYETKTATECRRTCPGCSAKWNLFLPSDMTGLDGPDSEAEGLGCRQEKCTPSRLGIGKLLSRTSGNSRAPYFRAPVSPPGCFRNETPCLPIRNFMHMTKQLISTRGASDLPRDAVASPTSLEIQVPPCSRSASAGLRL